MISVVVTRHFRVTIPKKLREVLRINEGDKVRMRVEGNKIVIEKIGTSVRSNCTDFLPDNFEKIQAQLRNDSRKRLKRLRIVPMRVLIDTSIFS
jgi:AbrB family looped-hinge helix DNA binding protein